MISQIRNSVFTKILWGLMGLYLLNISVDPADPNPEYIAENLTFNDQESIIEIIVEKILGYENAIREYDDNDTKDNNNKKNVKIDIFPIKPLHSKITQSCIKINRERFPDYNSYLTNGFHQLGTPPPEI